MEQLDALIGPSTRSANRMWDRHFHKDGEEGYMLFRAQIKAKRVCSPELLMMLQVVQWSFLSPRLLQQKLQQLTNFTAHGFATNKLRWLTLSALIIQMAWQAEFKVKVCFGCEAKEKIPCLSQQARHTAESSLLSQMPNQQICQRIWEKPPSIIFFH